MPDIVLLLFRGVNDTVTKHIYKMVLLEPCMNRLVIDVPNSEIYSTHKENILRAENGIPLRTYYGAYTNGSGISGTRLIKGNTSLFIQLNGSTNYERISNKFKSLRYVYK